MTIKNSLHITYVKVANLQKHKRIIRKYGRKQIEKTVRLIESVGWPLPILIDAQNRPIIGGAFIEAAKRMKIDEVPAIIADHLSEEQIRYLRIAYSRLSEEESWIQEELAEEIQELHIAYPDLDLTITGFEIPELDLLLEVGNQGDAEDELPLAQQAISIVKPGQLWILGEHRLYCGDSRDHASYSALLAGAKAQMGFWDPPYNVPIDGHVCGLGTIKHDKFLAASGEMSPEQFQAFLHVVFRLVAEFSIPGALHFVFMDWRHTVELQMAAKNADFTLKNLCVWVKDNGGMGSLYRSRHELIFLFKHGDAPHINNIELGRYGRYRTNVWEHPGVNTLRKGRMEDLAMHPTVKPVGLITEAIKDCSKLNGIILDPFGGSGSTLIACEKTGRLARLIEIDPKYCDVIIRRWQQYTGQDAILSDTGQTFNAIMKEQGAADD